MVLGYKVKNLEQNLEIFSSDMLEYHTNIFETFGSYEGFSVFFDSGEAMEILDQMFATLENSPLSLGFEEES